MVLPAPAAAQGRVGETRAVAGQAMVAHPSLVAWRALSPVFLISIIHILYLFKPSDTGMLEAHK